MTSSGAHPAASRTTIVRLAAVALRFPVALTAALVSTVLVTIFNAAIPLVTASAVDIATSDISGDIRSFMWLLIAVALGRYACQFGRRFTAGILANKMQHRLRVGLLSTMYQLDGPAQDQLRTGQLVSRSISDLNLVYTMAAMFPLVTGHLLTVITILGVMLWLSPVLFVTATAMLPVLMWLSVRSRATLFSATWSAQQKIADLATQVEETVTGIRVVKAFHQEQREIRKFVTVAGNIYGEMMRAARLTARFKPLLQQLPNVSLVLCIGVGGYLALTGVISIGTFVAFSVYMSQLTSVVSMLAGMIVQQQLGVASAQRVFDVLDLRPTNSDPVSQTPAPTGPLGLRMNHVSFGEALADFSLYAPPGDTVVMVGPPGAGKTMAVQLITGFYQPDSGSISLVDATGAAVDYADLSRDAVRGAMGCVFEDPFLFSTSIYDNIDAGRELSKDDIIAAARHAEIYDFISGLDNGFDTQIGERGLTLSGGQRQRIALARAIAEQPRILILDDATSAIDAATEAKIFDNLRTHLSGTTIIAVAHRMSTVGIADTVAVVDAGRITAIGPKPEIITDSRFTTLMTGAGDIGTQAASPHPVILDHDALTPEAQQLWPTDQPSSETAKPTMQMASAPSLQRGTGLRFAAQVPATAELLDRVAELPLVRDTPPPGGLDGFQQRLTTVSASRLFHSVRWLLAAAILLYVVGVAAGLAIPSLVRIALDSGVTAGNASVLWQVSLAGLAIVLLSWLVSCATTIVTALTGERLLYELRIRCYAHLQRLSLRFYETTMSGAIITRMTTDIDALNGFLQTGFTTALVAITTLAGITALLILTSIPLAAVALTGVPIIVIATVVFRRISTRLYARAREEISIVNASFHQAIAGLRTAQMLRSENTVLNHFNDKSQKYTTTRIAAQAAVALYFPGISAVSEILQAVVLGIGAAMVSDGTLAIGVLVAFLLYLERLYPPIQNLSQVFDSYQQAQVGFNRITDLLATKEDVIDVAETSDTDLPQAVDVEKLAESDIAVSNVSFSYGQSDRPVLSDVSVTLAAGRTVAIVGATGAGKSTLVKLLERFYDPVSGTIRAGDTNIRHIPLGLWRRQIGYVPQEAHLFSGTIASNIAYGNPHASQAEITEAARRVGALGTIAAIPGGFTAPVGEGGRGLSSGQRQLVALARAELITPKILLFDEATATVDPATESAILAATRRVAAGRTTVVVAHRLATAARADRILVFADGKIVEDGTHESLLTFGGIYATMWRNSTQ
ncbi:MAG: ABC transporter ATP-binding protein [Corynebacterium sp.]|uniref:ABC transporter ATP-binding protein n=1 Tax=Corynebacterium sp. TaxID=1720 RepID=UPI0026DDA0AC|nr:ABC transporter ATP-binding protein [Corynebacterium sp.]MDO5098904.1 ABC transporter ATP-binding protein [Corynebacterium sp.]